MNQTLSPTSTLALLQLVPPLPITEPLEHDSKPAPKEKSNLIKSILSTLAKVQKYSAYGFLAFFGLHVSSTIVVPGLGINIAKSQEVFEMTRAIYLSPLFEYPIVHGCAIVHVASGVLMRVLRLIYSPKKNRVLSERAIIINDERRDDIGLGGIGSILGFGFKKSWISSTVPSLTPLTFSGYVMATVLSYHMWKMKWAPILVDGDNSLISLNYITHYLSRHVNGSAWAAFNFGMLGLLLWVSFYHMVSGLFKYRRQFSSRAKKIAYGVISIFTTLSFVSIARLQMIPLDVGFIGKQFNRYLMRLTIKN